jgi:hypothetical protein
MNKICKLTKRNICIILTISFLLLSLNITTIADNNDGHSNQQFDLTNNQIMTISKNKLDLLDKDGFSIEEIHSYMSKQETPLSFHIVTLKPTGFLIITSQSTLPPVIGYSFTSSFNQSSPHYSTFIDFIKMNIQQRCYKMLNHTENTLYRTKWNHLLMDNPQIPTTTFYEQWPPEGYTSTGGWIETQWHQDAPFNTLCPLDLQSGRRGLAGCPAVAMAQILNYHRTICNVSFNDTDDYFHDYGQQFTIDDDYKTYDFPSFPQLNNFLETIQTHFDGNIPLTNTDKAALIFACGTAAKQVYTPQGSGTFGVSQAFDAYQKFNCEETSLLTTEHTDLYDRINQNIKQGLPVHLAIVNEAWTSGHNLIIDGYNTENFYHLNFGWDRLFDGWYDLPDELPLELTFIEGVIVDIRPSTDIADLSAHGNIQFTDINAGSQINASFIVKNIGQSYSNLSWEIDSYPPWGVWQFSSKKGTNLTPEKGEIIINVTIDIPSRNSKTFTGGIKIINSNSPSDFEIVLISITTPKTTQLKIFPSWINLLQKFHPILFQFIK